MLLRSPPEIRATLLALSAVLSCAWGCDGRTARDGAPADASSESTVPTVVTAPAGHCGQTPQLVVSSGSIALPTDAGPAKGFISTIAVTATNLYYTTAVVLTGSESEPFVAGSLMTIPLDSEVPSEVASGYLFTTPVVTSTSLVVGARGELMPNLPDAILSAPLSGGPWTPLVTLGNGNMLINGLAVDDTYVYFTDTTGVQAVPLAPSATGSSPTTLVAAPNPGAVPDVVGVVGQRLVLIYPQGQMASIPLPPQANASVTALGTTGYGPTDMMPCAGNLCWVDEGDDTLETIGPTGTTPSTTLPLPAAVSDATDYAYDGATLYLSGADPSQSTQTLERIPAGGGSPEVLVTMPYGGGSAAVAVGDACVYWASQYGIFSLAKTAQGPFQF